MAPELPKITVHWLNNSRAQRILWLLEELQLPYNIELYHRTPLEAPPSLAKIHPLGKSPVVTLQSPSASSPLVLAESSFIASYLATHFAGRDEAPATSSLVPRKWKPGQEGQVGGETDAWMRHEYLLHYNEGSFFPIVVTKLILDLFSSPLVPFFVRPIAGFVAGKFAEGYIFPNAKKHLRFLEDMLKDVPRDGEDGEAEGKGEGQYLCGNKLTAVDILMSYALVEAKDRFANAGPWSGSIEKEFPKLWAYVARLESEEGYKRSVKKIEELEKTKSDTK